VGGGDGRLREVVGDRCGLCLRRCPSSVGGHHLVVEVEVGVRSGGRSLLFGLCRRLVARDLVGRRIFGRRFAMIVVVGLGRSIRRWARRLLFRLVVLVVALVSGLARSVDRARVNLQRWGCLPRALGVAVLGSMGGRWHQ